MPLYEFACENCEYNFEEYQTLADKPLKKCPNCKKNKLIKLISLPANPVVKKDIQQTFQEARLEGKKMAKEILRGNQEIIADVYGESKKELPKPKTLDKVKNGKIKRKP